MTEIVLRQHHELTASVRRTLLDLYADVRAPLLHMPNYAVQTFAERLDRHGGEPGFEAVVGYDRGEPVGYAYGNTIESGDRWWTRMAKPMTPEVTADPTFALKELGVRIPWRGTGIARSIHEELAGGRAEERITLMVNPAAGDGKVLALYEAWGYEAVNEVQPNPDAPPLVAMIRACRP
ncbi:GNAT family N-acetyltransferase [Kitasatospora aureofaciens]|uniref:GNAT family N-acetyltransferase n=1 Tax=Kitasatospora aureofaciens TaxID=1894 RepID=UPI001C4659C6|nr:GNAT family N-acetyltransferase [Kitasatospora aureofaciens]MBV6701255.1 GNAT family N-acetyltransferase [Kitasatospora aureofaciens]